jgi:hypothetical protein
METYKPSPQFHLACVEILPSDRPKCYSKERLCIIFKICLVMFKKGNSFVFAINYKIKVKLSLCLTN